MENLEDWTSLLFNSRTSFEVHEMFHLRNKTNWGGQKTALPFHLLIFVTKGNYKCFSEEGQIFTAETGDLIYYPPGCLRYFKFDPAVPVSDYRIHFSLGSEENIPVLFGTPTKLKTDPAGGMHIRNLFSLFSSHQLNPEPLIQERCRALLGLFFADQLQHSEKRGLNSEQINGIKQFLDDHPDQNTTSSDLASLLGYSPAYFTRKFSATMKISPRSYILRHRILAAAKLLQEGDPRVQDVMDYLGMSNVFLFYRQFKQVMGMTVGEFKKKN